jgi:hypothetical protein
MLKITTQNDTYSAAITLEGKISGAWVDVVERTWNLVVQNYSPKNILVDLCNVTFIDAEGKKLLRWMCGEGAFFKTRGCVAGGVVQEIENQCGRLRQPS